jgi:hypothetical protein
MGVGEQLEQLIHVERLVALAGEHVIGELALGPVPEDKIDPPRAQNLPGRPTEAPRDDTRPRKGFR